MKAKNKYFIEMSRSKRKALYISLKNKIIEAKKKKGANFLSNAVYDGKNSWDDIYFLSSKNGVFYNVTIETLKSYWHQMLDGIATEKMLKNDGKYDYDLLEKYQQELIKDKSIFVYEEVRKDTNYYYGVGLYVTLNEDFLTIENINKFIEDFIKNGEKEYRIPKKHFFSFEDNAGFFITKLEV